MGKILHIKNFLSVNTGEVFSSIGMGNHGILDWSVRVLGTTVSPALLC